MTHPLPDLLISIPDGVLDLSWGHPSPRLHAVDALQEATAHALAKTGVATLQYGAEQGFGQLLESLADFLSRQDAYAMHVHPATLFLTCGASQAIDLICTLFAREGDTVFVEEPTYYLVSRIFTDHHLQVVGVPTDAEGLRVDALDAMLSDATVPKPALLYTIPTFQNPSGTVLSLERRQALVELAQRHGFLLLSDDVYQLLHYGPPPPPPLVAFDTTAPGCVISLGSFSKILAPGLRLGWVQANPAIIQRFIAAGMTASGGGLNHFVSTLVHAVLERDLLTSNIATLRAAYSERVQALAAALQTRLPHEISFAIPGGGYFFWLNCQPAINTETLLPLAQKAGVSYRPGPGFSPSKEFTQSLRVSFALYEVDALEQAVERLAQALAAYPA
ncbi:MAG: PLP-dependent aminotransferase family protein [Candidatus Tectomicrobia bacterium]|nr:PLP-dependent aminotransferase family protein [Candidatus Tectomicrobia bacterium]